MDAGWSDEPVLGQCGKLALDGGPVLVPVLRLMEEEIADADLAEQAGGITVQMADARCQRPVRALDRADELLDEVAVGAGDEARVAVDERLPVDRRPEHRLAVVAADARGRGIGED